MTTADWIAERRRIEQAASDGPWIAEYSGEQGNCVIPGDAQSTREAVALTRLYRQAADAEFIADARTSAPKMRAALEAVLALHEPLDALNVRYNRTQRVCTGCGQDDGNWVIYPCPTVRAITKALT